MNGGDHLTLFYCANFQVLNKACTNKNIYIFLLSFTPLFLTLPFNLLYWQIIRFDSISSNYLTISLTPDSRNARVHIWITATSSFSAKAEDLANSFSAFTSNHLPHLQIAPIDAISTPSFSFKTHNLVFGTVAQFIDLFASETLTTPQIDSVLLDDLDYALSLGSTGNLERLFAYLKARETGFFKRISLQVNVHDDERTGVNQFKETLGVKFTCLRVFPEESDTEKEVKDYQLTKRQEVALKKENKGVLQEMLHQFFYTDSQTNVYSMVYLLLKFQVFPKRTILIVPDLAEAYR